MNATAKLDVRRGDDAIRVVFDFKLENTTYGTSGAPTVGTLNALFDGARKHTVATLEADQRVRLA